jgi:hypothetical protein
MPTYILLSSWTQKGIENVKESPNRLDKAKEEFRALGVEIKEKERSNDTPKNGRLPQRTAHGNRHPKPPETGWE